MLAEPFSSWIHATSTAPEDLNEDGRKPSASSDASRFSEDRRLTVFRRNLRRSCTTNPCWKDINVGVIFRDVYHNVLYSCMVVSKCHVQRSYLFSCAVIECPVLTNPLDGVVIVNDNIPGETASYDCDPGLGLMGNTRRQCTQVGVWTGAEPTCEGTYIPIHLRLLVYRT